LEGILLFVHIVVCMLLIVVVLLQSGKSADLAGAFGGYGSQSTFGPRGTATILSKMTTILAIMFMVLTLLLMIVASKKSGTRSVLGPDAVKQEQKAETSGKADVTETSTQGAQKNSTGNTQK
jgi:preprotein translocase subunit SecG